jgi:hypothetical protein
MKLCKRCFLEKNYNDFHKNKQTKDGYAVYCKPCKSATDKKWINSNPERVKKRNKKSKDWRAANPLRSKELVAEWKEKNPDRKWILDKKSHLWTHYRLTIEDYQKIFNDQDGKCWICKESKKLVVDHDHDCCNKKISCGKCIRGLICYNCNALVGFLERNISLIDKASEYIKNFDKGRSLIN